VGTARGRPARPASACSEPLTDPGSTDGGQPPAVRLLGVADIRAIAADLGLRPSKGRGQNFVHDPNTVRRIVRIAAVSAADIVLEVGPGIGSLTLGLLGTGAAVVALEVDAILATALPATLRRFAPDVAGRCRVVRADALRVNRVDGPPPTALVSNLPYNVAVPVLLNLLDVVPSVRTGLVLVQQEVADRLAAAPGSRTYGVPSVKAAWYADLRNAGSVPRTVFWPVPKVDSGLVALTRRDAPTTSVSRRQVFTVVDAAFATRRKTLRAALAPLAGSADAAERALIEARVDPGARGETLPLQAFCRIAERLADAARGT
jgi:16S rRNA (adenine1518-N6/adenine1519-N6)-dimethyltransferase